MEVNNPFEYINSINYKYEVTDLKGYSTFLTNRFYSYFRDTILLANIANDFRVNSEQNYDFWYNCVSKRKRFVPKWHKKITLDDHIQMVAERFQVNRVRAREMMTFISDDELKNIELWWKQK